MKSLFLIIIVLFITACDMYMITTKVNNQTQFNTEMTLYSNGVVSKSFRIEKSTSTVIHTDSGPNAIPFRASEYDSIKFNFENYRLLVFVNDTVHSPNDIYNGANWVIENKKEYQIFTYTIDNELIK